MAEFAEELHAEKSARNKAEKMCADLQRQLELMTERAETDQASLQNQVEMNRRLEMELQKLQKDLSESQALSDGQLAALRKKNQDIQNEFTDQFEILYKTKHKLEKEKQQLKIEVDDVHANLDDVVKEKTAAERTIKQLEHSLAESHTKLADMQREVTELAGVKVRCLADNSDLVRKLDELQTELNRVNIAKQTLTQQVEEARNAADNEGKSRSKMASDNRALQTVVEELRTRLEEEEETNASIQRQLMKANSEITALKDKLDAAEAGSQTEEVEDVKRKMAVKLQECETQFDAAVAKAMNLDKQKGRLQQDLETRTQELNKCQAISIQLEKKQKQLEKAVEEWRRRAMELEAECNQTKKECHSLVSELYVLKSHLDETDETRELLRRDNKNLSEEIQDLTDQLTEGSRKLMETEKACKRLEHDKEQLLGRLEEMENSLIQEANKVQRVNIDLNNYRAEVERRIAEKDEEMENQRKTHQRALDVMQTSLETEARAKLDVIRQRKKLEQEMIDLENLLEETNRARCEAEKSYKKFTEQIADLELVIEDEQQVNNHAKDSLAAAEKKSAQLTVEVQQLRVELDAAERANKSLCSDLQESVDRVNELTAANAALVESKRQVEIDFQAIQMDKDDYINELRLAEDHARKAMADASQLAEELRQEQGQATQFEKIKRGLENHIKELQARVDELEATAMQGGKKVIQKLEQRVHDLELELESEQHRHNETAKSMGRQERRMAEIGGQIEEQRMMRDKLQNIIDQLHQKLKTYKRQLDIAEETANNNLSKFRKIHQEYEEAMDRATVAESSLTQLRARNRQSSVEPSHSFTVSF